MHDRPVSIKEHKPMRQAVASADLASVALVFYIFTTVVLNEGDVLNLASKVLLVVAFSLEALNNKMRLSPFFVVAALFVIYSAASVSWSVAPSASMPRVMTFANQFVCYFAAICLIRWNRERMHLCLTCFVLSAFVSAAYVIAIQGVTFQEDRYSGDAVSSGQLALTSALAMTVCVYRYFVTKRKAYLISTACLALSLVLTSGRRGFLIITVFVILLALSNTRGLEKKIFTAFAAIIGVVLLLWLCMTNEFLYSYIGVRLESFFNFALFGEVGDSSTQGRARLIDFGMQLFSESPMIGNGISSFESVFMTQHAAWGTSADNNYVELLADLGITGLILYYVPLIVLLTKAIRNWHTASPLERYATLCLIAMCAVDFATVWIFSKVGMLYIAILCEVIWECRKSASLYRNPVDEGEYAKQPPPFSLVADRNNEKRVR